MTEIKDKAGDTIFDTWELYRKIVSSNHMFHQEIYADVATVLQIANKGFALLDLGCGDAVMLAPVLAALPIGRYCGVDLSATALAFAGQNLDSLACAVHLQHGDLLQVLCDSSEHYEVIFTSFALHHLSHSQKAEFFAAAYAHLKADGFLLLIDTFRAEHEDLPGYLAAYCAWLRNDWQDIDEEEKNIACEHIVGNDFPETLATYEAFSQHAGFSACHTISRYQWHNVLRFQR